MSTIVPTTGLERAAGSLTADVSLTLVAAAAGSPLAALLPVLGKTLAAERQRKRVEATLVAMDELLKAHSRQLEELTDPQYKFARLRGDGPRLVFAYAHFRNQEGSVACFAVVTERLSSRIPPSVFCVVPSLPTTATFKNKSHLSTAALRQ
jgi:hypothetical protein